MPRLLYTMIKENTITELGKILISPGDTILTLVTEIKNRFGLLGEITFQIACEPKATSRRSIL